MNREDVVFKQGILAVVAAIALVLASAMPAQAAQASISPSSQSVSNGALAVWNGTYQGTGGGTATAHFYYGNGDYFPQYANGETVHTYQRFTRFYPCQARSYKQELPVWKNGSLQAYASPTTYVSGGDRC